MKKEVEKELYSIVKNATERPLTPEDFEGVCKALNVVKMYYDLEFDAEGYRGLGDGDENPSRYRVFELYSEDVPSDIKRRYTFYYENSEYVHAIIEFRTGITEEDIDDDLCGFLANTIYLLVSRQNMRSMLDFAETHDTQTGIMNVKLLVAN